MKLLLDTNRYSDLARKVPEVVERVKTASELWLSIVSLGELRYGFVRGSRRSENEKHFQQFMANPVAGILFLDIRTTDFYASIRLTLKNQGTPIPGNDIWIAALALQHDLTLGTRDDHFDDVPGLKLVDSEA